MPNTNRLDENGVSHLILLLKDYLMTSAEKTKLSGIESGAEVNAIESVKVNGSALTPDANRAVDVTVPTYSNATTSAAGLMSSDDKTKLNGIESGAEANVIDEVQVNGTALTPSSGAVNVVIPVTEIQVDGTALTPSSGAVNIALTNAINAAISGISGISFEIVNSLPSTGSAGKIYLIANSGTGTNVYDEYIYINNAWEKLGTTAVDLSGYFNTTNLPALTNAEIEAIFNTVMGIS